MKPQRAKRADNRRAAMHLAELSWLDGFPVDNRLAGRAVGGRWHVLGAVEPIEIGGERIAKSRRSARTLLREHRDELADRVGDVDRWWSIVDAKLAWCSAPIRALDLIDARPPRSAKSTRQLAAGALGPAIHAAAIAWATRPVVLARAIEWLAARPGVTAYGVETAIELALLAELGGDVGVDALIALVEVDAPDPKLAVQRVANVEARVKSTKTQHRRAEAPPPPTSRDSVTTWLRALIAREPAVKRRTIELLAVADLAGALRPWRDWHDAYDAAIVRANGYIPRKTEQSWPNLVGVLAKLEAVKKAIPPGSIEIAEVLYDIDLLAGDPHHAAAVRLVAHLPASTPIAKPRLIIHCARIAATADDTHAAWIWGAIADELDRGASPKLFAIWLPSIASGAHVYVETDLFEGPSSPSRALIRRWAAIVAKLASPSQPAALSVAMWLAAGLADDLIAPAVDAEVQERFWHSVELARAAMAIADGTPADLVARLDQLVLLGEHTVTTASALGAIARHAASSGATWLVRDILATQPDAFVELARLAALVPMPRWPEIATTPSAPWIARYPAALAPALTQLASVRPDAEAAASKRLATDLPVPEALRREIAALRARAPLAPALAKRLANLEDRLRDPKLPSPRRLARLAAGITHLAATTGFARFVDDMTTVATARIAKWFGLGDWPGWRLDRLACEIFLGLARLDDHQRALAGRLLRARLGPKPWDLRDDPANRAFVDNMRARGLVMEPWLDDAPVSVRAGDGAAVELALAGDPLDVFGMGLHFQTCLSPDGGNFFSVVTNAADVNKRVLYARRAGAVVGRCLLAITDGGAVLAFHAYAHDHALRFHEVVRDYVRELAARMHTVTAPTGKVSLVLASDWYDDGPRDLVGRFTKLYALDLAVIAPEDLVAALRAALEHELDDITLPYVLGHGGFAARPALVIPLAPHLFRSTVEPHTMIAAANLAWRAGDGALADRLLGDRGDSIDLDYPIGALLAELRPSHALARLRATRGRAKRSWRDESPGRQAVAALALAALHRPRQAAVLVELVRAAAPNMARELDRRLTT